MTRDISPYSVSQRGQQDVRRLTEENFSEIEKSNPEGLTTQQIVDVFSSNGEKLTEATFRKYVQLGLLPRSVRIGRKGRHRGSQGLYPSTVVRQIDIVRGLMSQGITIEEIQRDYPFLSGEIDDLSHRIKRLFFSVEQSTTRSELGSANDQVVVRALSEAKKAAEELLDTLRSIERRLLVRARMARAAV
jgi:hypothetical protein